MITKLSIRMFGTRDNGGKVGTGKLKKKKKRVEEKVSSRTKLLAFNVTKI